MRKYLFLILSCLIFPVQAFGYGCDCGTINAMITMAKTETIQSVNANTTVEANAIRSEIVMAAQNIIGTIKTESATIVRAIISLKESNAAMIKGQTVANESVKTQDTYGTASQPSGLCGATSLGAGLQLSVQAGNEVQATMREKQAEYANALDMRPVDYLYRILDGEHPQRQEIVEAFYPLESTLTEEQVAQAHEAIKTLSNPRPMPVVTEEQKNTLSGQTYSVARDIHDNRLAVVTENLNSHIVYHAPTLPDDVTAWAKNQWTEAGGSTTIPGLVDGKLSEAGLYKLLSQMRVGNPNWFMQIASMTDTGLLRELVLMQAFQFELNRKNTELLDRIAFTSSLDSLIRMEETSGKELNDLYTRMIGTQQ